jgi:hypothetical protein
MRRSTIFCLGLSALVGLACQQSQVMGGNVGGGGRGPQGGAPGSGGGPAPSFGVPDAGSGAGADAPPTRPPGAGEQCVEEAIRGEVVPLHLMLVLDASGSMRLNIGGRTRWQRVSDAIDAFMRDPRSAGLFVGLQVFPFTIHGKPCASDADCGFGGGTGMGDYWCARPFVCVDAGATMPAADAKLCDPNDAFCPGQRCAASGVCSVSGRRCLTVGQACPGGPAGDRCQDAPRVCKFQIDSCEAADYVRPRVPIAQLPGAAASMSAGLVAVQPGGNTPITPAVVGAADHLRTHLAALSGPRAGALVMASDVAPTACGNSAEPGVIQAIMNARNGTPSLPTYVIGAITPGDNIRTELARQFATAGGTGMPFLLGNTTADLGDRFLEALAAIRGSALPCQFRIAMPSAGTIDYGKVNVRYNGPAGPDDLRYVGSADKCDPMRGGWYYDVDPAQGKPSTVHVCPATCARFKSEMGGAVELRFGCRTRID